MILLMLGNTVLSIHFNKLYINQLPTSLEMAMGDLFSLMGVGRNIIY